MTQEGKRCRVEVFANTKVGSGPHDQAQPSFTEPYCVQSELHKPWEETEGRVGAQSTEPAGSCEMGMRHKLRVVGSEGLPGCPLRLPAYSPPAGLSAP